jgi:hypothetical protein
MPSLLHMPIERKPSIFFSRRDQGYQFTVYFPETMPRSWVAFLIKFNQFNPLFIIKIHSTTSKQHAFSTLSSSSRRIYPADPQKPQLQTQQQTSINLSTQLPHQPSDLASGCSSFSPLRTNQKRWKPVRAGQIHRQVREILLSQGQVAGQGWRCPRSRSRCFTHCLDWR